MEGLKAYFIYLFLSIKFISLGLSIIIFGLIVFKCALISEEFDTEEVIREIKKFKPILIFELILILISILIPSKDVLELMLM